MFRMSIELVASLPLVANLQHPVVLVFVLSVLDRPHPIVQSLELFEAAKLYLRALVCQRLDRCQDNCRSARAHRNTRQIKWCIAHQAELCPA